MFELRVLSGLHLGAALPLFGDTWLIGQAEEADLMLSDDGVAAQHCRLRLEGDRWQAEPESAQPFTVSVGLAFRIADVWLCVAQNDTPWADCMPPAVSEPAPVVQKVAPAVTARKSGFSRGMRTLAVSLVLLATLTVMSWILQPSAAQTQVAPPPAVPTASELQAPLLKMLRERELLPAVKVDAHDNRVRLSGRLSAAQMKIFERMMARFTSEHGSDVEFDNQVQLLKVALPFRIVQITTGNRANIVTDEGQRLFVGDEIDNLRLVAITNNQIEFNGRDNITVSW